MKAVIMAGGEGERMRPLTCSVPKPMLRLCGQPTIKYILELLRANGCTEVAVTARYLADQIKEYLESEEGRLSGLISSVSIASAEKSQQQGGSGGQGQGGSGGQGQSGFGTEGQDGVNGQQAGMKVVFVEETEKLGTAGGVKLAARDFNEPFLVISGDALCDFDLKRFGKLHGGSNNEVSILLTKVADPREYGLVTLTKFGKVSSFIEKPGWSRAVSDLANTGIYFMNPQVLSYIPDGIQYDFSKDLFPKMMKTGKIIGGYEQKGYWCDIGDFNSYIKCQGHMMLKKVKTSLRISESYVCSNDGRIPGGKYKIVPPVYIGENVRVGEGSVIGPGVVIDDGCVIGGNVHIKQSVVLQNVKVGNNARVTGSILAENATVKNSAELYDSSVLGAFSVLGEKSAVLQNVLIWPNKMIPPMVRVFENVVVQPPQRDFFDDGGVKGSADTELNPALCAKLGRACASIKSGIKIGVATDGTRAAKALRMAIQSGAMSSGGYVWDFGDAFMAQMPFFVSFCGLDLGIFIKNSSGDGNDVSLTFCGSDGLPLQRSKEREIEKRLQKSDFIRADINKGRDITSITSIRIIYSQEICRLVKNDLSGISVAVESKNPEISRVFRECLDRAGATYSEDLEININEDGTEFSMQERKYPKVTMDVLCAVCCNNEFREGKDVALSMNAPLIIDDIAKMYSRRVFRYFDSPTDASDDTARRLAACQAWSKDVLFMAMKVLKIMNDRKLTLHELVDEIPKFYTVSKELIINFSPVKLKDIFDGGNLNANVAFAQEGLSITNDIKGVRATVTPSKKGNKLRILTEANSSEQAEEFAIDISQRIATQIYSK